MRRISVVGDGEAARSTDIELAKELGEAIARKGWALITGGRNAGVMGAVTEGAKSVTGAVTVGILPGRDASSASPLIDLPILTDLGSARNNVVVLSGEVVIACGEGGAGTTSEIALAIKAGRPVILLEPSRETAELFRSIGGALVSVAGNVNDAIEQAAELLD